MRSKPLSPAYDTLLRRFGAFAIDYTLLSVVLGTSVGVLAVLLSLVSFSLGYFLMIIAHLLCPVYFIVGEAFYGGTLGKRLTGLRVTTATGEQIGLGAAIKRWLWMIVMIFGGVILQQSLVVTLPEELALVGGLFALFGAIGWFACDIHHAANDPRRRALHDVFAGTVVTFAGWSGERTTAQPVGESPRRF